MSLNSYRIYDSRIRNLYEDVFDTNLKLPLLSILNWGEFYFKEIVFDVFNNGFEKVQLLCLLNFIRI